ncbi:MAG: lipocalin family protein [Acidobacteria bacterium]|uniref:Lipocalin family protein n=1 Tax=Candidatus Polarisedimenticola svalbardensis TaxID=2886004 RepID=A0A8J7C2V6_9BACT|nr:lipocalin family protein [Candidatus Polarisedimenticola svalbardensis]
MRLFILMTLTLFLMGCATHRLPELKPVAEVDLERFMGDWYVLAAIPTRIERKSFNAVESYKLDTNGSIDTTFTFNKGGFDGPKKRYSPRGFVREGTGNAIWGMRFIWPIKADYRIIDLGLDYRTVIIGRQKRDYVWVMARSPEVDDETWCRLERKVAVAGYDLALLRRVPHRRPAGEDDGS